MSLDERDALLEEYERSTSLGGWVIYIALPWALLRRVGVDPLSRRGSLLTGLFTFGWLFVSAIVVALVTGTLHESPLFAWLAVAAIEGVDVAWATGAYGKAHEDYGALDTALSLEDLRAQVARQRRWGGVAKSATASAAIGLLLGVVIFSLSSGGWSQVPPGSIWLLLVVLFWVGELVFGMTSSLAEDRLYVRQRFQLPAYRPIDSPLVRQYLRGARRSARNNATWSTLFLVDALVLLPHDAALILPFAAVILGVCYGLTIARVLSDRWVVARIVGEEKSRRLADLGSQIDALITRLPDLSSEDERKLDQLRKVYDDVRESPLTITPSSAVGRILSTALVPTIVFVALAVAEGYVERVVNQILDRFGS